MLFNLFYCGSDGVSDLKFYYEIGVNLLFIFQQIKRCHILLAFGSDERRIEFLNFYAGHDVEYSM